MDRLPGRKFTSMSCTVSRGSIVAAILALTVFTAPVARAEDHTEPVRGADELYWTPTLEQALEMSKATGRPIFLMGYSLVGNGSTYTKMGEDYCTGVY